MAVSAAYSRRTTKGGCALAHIPGGLNAGVTGVIACDDLSSWVGATANGPTRAMVNRAGATPEEIEITAVSGNNITIPTGGRGLEGTSDTTHGTNATIEIVSSPRDFDEANKLVNQTLGAMTGNALEVFRVNAGATAIETVPLASSLLSDFTEASQDVVGAMVVAAGGTYDDTAGSITFLSLTQVKHSTSQSLSHNTEAALVFDTEDFDTASQHSTASNTDRITIAATGVYEISGQVTFAANSTGTRTASIKNGSTYLFVASDGGHSSSVSTVAIPSFTVSCSSGDILRVYGYQDSGGSLNVTGEDGNKRSTFLRVRRVS